MLSQKAITGADLLPENVFKTGYHLMVLQVALPTCSRCIDFPVTVKFENTFAVIVALGALEQDVTSKICWNQLDLISVILDRVSWNEQLLIALQGMFSTDKLGIDC